MKRLLVLLLMFAITLPALARRDSRGRGDGSNRWYKAGRHGNPAGE